MYIIAGLGNPGKKYENTRHNMGFIAIDLLAEEYGIQVDKLKFKSLVGEGRIADQRVLLMKPQTYMNLSGEAIRDAVNFYKIDPQELIVIYDDIDIPAGTFRIRKKGSAGTHNGMRSVVYQLQTDQFPRIRVGIGTEKPVDLIHFVTGGVSGEERKLLEGALEKSAKAAAAIVEKGIEKAMNEYNVRPKKEKPE
ncbi:MAG: aminoacyl-tRNA hydrolase [Firmicutes bacterium]|nr:aminoacyl-tRNA hydrolase [Bacillota bacterium]MDD7601051.1 aminoacyl-tRNA hydrolase [Bacillota bacterium]MDY5856071.1 aminoacyl-tRNA hydrolase [Anaerovoracaceae bacterium]